jgi:hypothetical protein
MIASDWIVLSLVFRLRAAILQQFGFVARGAAPRPVSPARLKKATEAAVIDEAKFMQRNGGGFARERAMAPPFEKSHDFARPSELGATSSEVRS